MEVPMTGCPERKKKGGLTMLEGGVAMRPYERPTLTKAGSFKKLTGLSGSGPKDSILKHQLL
jgi:hypothetical protein